MMRISETWIKFFFLQKYVIVYHTDMKYKLGRNKFLMVQA